MLLDRFKKRRVQACRQFKLVLNHWHSTPAHLTCEIEYEDYPTHVAVARTHRRRYLVGKQPYIEVGWSRNAQSLQEVYKPMRAGINIEESIENSEREAIIRALWRLTEKLARDPRSLRCRKDELWNRVVTGFILGESLDTERPPITVPGRLSPMFEMPEEGDV